MTHSGVAHQSLICRDQVSDGGQHARVVLVGCTAAVKRTWCSLGRDSDAATFEGSG